MAGLHFLFFFFFNFEICKFIQDVESLRWVHFNNGTKKEKEKWENVMNDFCWVCKVTEWIRYT